MFMISFKFLTPALVQLCTLFSLTLIQFSVLCQNVAPISWKLGQSVISSCADKLRPVLKNAVEASAIALDEYAPVIASICGSSSNKTEHLVVKQGYVFAELLSE